MTAPSSRNNGDSNDKTLALSQPTDQEIAWAKAIRLAVQEHPVLDELAITDWEYLQHAIVAKDNVSKALVRIQKIQDFKKRYGIQGDGSTDDARRDLEICFQTHPGFFCAISSLDNRNQDETRPFPQLLCYQYRYFNGHIFQSEEAYAVFLRACFYICHAAMPHVAALRSGMFFMADTRGFSWRSTFNLQAELRVSELLSHAYPMRIYGATHLHVSTWFRFAYALVRSFLSAKFQRMVVMVGTGSAAKAYLDSLHLPDASLPTKWGGTFRQGDMYDTLIRRLDERYKNSAAFHL